MTEPTGPIGINFTGNASAVDKNHAMAVKALAEAASAWARAIEAIATHGLQGTPGITNSTISGCSISMGEKPTVRRERK